MPRRAETLLLRGRRWLADGGEALPAWTLLGLICLASAATLVILGARLTFFNDEWYILLLRPGLSADSLFDPHNEHLIALPVLIYKGLVSLFGLESQVPFRLVLAATVVALAVVVFLFVRERAGKLLALLAATLLVFLGPSWENLLWSFQIGFMGSLATGIGVLLALERDTPRRNATACILLVVSILFSDLGIPFVVAAAVAVGLRRRPSQLWIPAIPTVGWGLWWLAYGQDAPSNFSLGNLARTPQYLLDSISSGLASLTGLTEYGVGTLFTDSWGRPLLVIAVVAVAAWLLRGGRPSRYTLVVASAALTFWVLAGANFAPGREPVASRYQLIDATFLVLLAAELFRPVRLAPGVLAGVAALGLIALGSNLSVLNSGYDFLTKEEAITKADLGALEIARGRVPADFQLLEDVAHSTHLSGVIAGPYFEQTDAHGSPPTYSPAQLAAAASEARIAADNVLAAAYRMDLRQVPTPRRPLPGCRRLGWRFDGTVASRQLAPGSSVVVTNVGSAPVDVGVRRFAPPGQSIRLGSLVPGFSARISTPVDSVRRPWQLVAGSGGAIEACPE